MLCLGIIGATSSLSMAQTKENEKLIPFGDFNSWMVRIIDESFVIGGNTKTLYEVAPLDTIIGDKPYISSTVSLGEHPTLWPKLVESRNVVSPFSRRKETTAIVYVSKHSWKNVKCWAS